MASGLGTAVIDFGAIPGSNEASVTVTGIADITDLSCAEAWIMAEASEDHTLQDHTYAAHFMSLCCGVPVTGDGFVIYARATEKLSGTYKVRYVWAN